MENLKRCFFRFEIPNFTGLFFCQERFFFKHFVHACQGWRKWALNRCQKATKWIGRINWDQKLYPMLILGKVTKELLGEEPIWVFRVLWLKYISGETFNLKNERSTGVLCEFISRFPKEDICALTSKALLLKDIDKPDIEIESLVNSIAQWWHFNDYYM